MPKTVRVKLDGDPSGKMETAAIKLPFDARDVWGKTRVPVKVTINGYMWRSTVAKMDGCQFIVVNREARKGAGVKAGDLVSITLEMDTEKRDVAIPAELKKALGAKLAQKLDALAFTHKKEFVQWYSGAKKEKGRDSYPEAREDEADAGHRARDQLTQTGRLVYKRIDRGGREKNNVSKRCGRQSVAPRVLEASA